MYNSSPVSVLDVSINHDELKNEGQIEKSKLLSNAVQPPLARGIKEERSELNLYVDLLLKDGTVIDVHALIDSGCTGSFIDASFIECYQISTTALSQHVDVLNANGSTNEGGKMTSYVELTLCIEDH